MSCFRSYSIFTLISFLTRIDAHISLEEKYFKPIVYALHIYMTGIPSENLKKSALLRAARREMCGKKRWRWLVLHNYIRIKRVVSMTIKAARWKDWHTVHPPEAPHDDSYTWSGAPFFTCRDPIRVADYSTR